MAKKPAARKADVRTASTEEELKAVRLELPVDVHRELRIEAAERDTHMSALARIAVEEFLFRGRRRRSDRLRSAPRGLDRADGREQRVPIHGDLTMSTITKQPPSIVPSYRMTADEFDRISEGLDKPAELIDGQLVERPDMNPEHAAVTELVRPILDAILKGRGWYAREERLPRGRVQRAVAGHFGCAGHSTRLLQAASRPGIAALLVEVSWLTLVYDRGEKRELYAAQGVPVYWIIDVRARKVEVYTGPGADGYSACVTYKPGESVPVVIKDVEVGWIAVADILPPDPAAENNGA